MQVLGFLRAFSASVQKHDPISVRNGGAHPTVATHVLTDGCMCRSFPIQNFFSPNSLATLRGSYGKC